MAAPDILRVRLSAEGIQEVMGALRKIETETKKVKANVTGFGGELKTMMAGMGFAAATAGMARMVKSAIDYGDKIEEMTGLTGAAAETVSTLGVAARKDGVELDVLAKGLKKFAQFSLDAQRGGAGAALTLKNLGLSLEDLKGKNIGQQMEVIAKAMEQHQGLNRSALAMELFGKAGADLEGVLEVLAKVGFVQLQEEGRKTGEVIDQKMADSCKAAKTEFAGLQAQVNGLTIEFAGSLIPELVGVSKAIAQVNADGKNLASTFGSTIGKFVKGLTGAFVLAFNLARWFFDYWAVRISAAGDRIGLFWDTVTGKSAIGDFRKNLKEIDARANAAKMANKDFMKQTQKETWDFWETMYAPQAAAAGTTTDTGDGKGGGKITGTDKPAKAAKKNIDALKSEIKAFSDLNEDFYKRGLIDLETYLVARRTAIEREFAAELSIADPEKRKDLEIRKEAELQALEREGAKMREDALMAQLKLEAELEEKTVGAGEKALALLRAEYDQRIKLAQGAQAKAALTELRDKALAYEKAKQAQQDYLEIEKKLSFDLQVVEQQRTLGRISETEAMQAQTIAYQQYLSSMTAAAQAFQAAALATGNQDMILQADQVMLKIDELSAKTSKVKDEYAQLKATAQDALQQGLETALMDIVSGTKSASDAFKDMARSIIASIQQVIIKMMVMKAMEKMGMGGKGFATGGMVYGPGSGTSDSIQARLSNGEFVVRAAAVAAYGPRFFNALNGIRIPKDQLPGYAEGGLVNATPAQSPARAEIGGHVVIELSDGLISRQMESREGQQALLKVIGKNPRTVRNLLR